MSKKKFFDWEGRRSHEKFGNSEFELPILYFRDDVFTAFFSANLKKVKDVLPTTDLKPVTLTTGKAMVVVGAFNYIDTSIGPYGEIVVGIPVVWKTKSIPIFSGLLEKYYPGFGIFVLHLPVTKKEAMEAGRGVWNYPKFVSDMYFKNTPESASVRMFEEKEYILGLKVNKLGPIVIDNRPIITYTEKNGDIIKTVIPSKNTYRLCVRPNAGSLELGEHTVSETIKELQLGKNPIMVRYYIDRWGILPEGDIVGKSEKRYNGYIGKEREKGEHKVSYI